MIQLNENGITDELQDDINDASIRITNSLIKSGYVPDCTDTDDESEFEVQDIIRGEILKMLRPQNNFRIEEVSEMKIYVAKYYGDEFEVTVTDGDVDTLTIQATNPDLGVPNNLRELVKEKLSLI